jgi:hypothetical protein
LETEHISRPIPEDGIGDPVVGTNFTIYSIYWKAHSFKFKYCAVFTNKKAWNDVKEIWIPEYNQRGDRIWFQDEELIREAVISLGVSKPSKTI